MATDAPTVVGAAAIRRLTPGDIDAVQRLLSQRDAREWDAASTNWFLSGLDPSKCLAWAAFDGEKPVGLTTMFLRTLRIRGVEQPAAYWANLYVDPQYRDQMLYPRLPMTMLNALKGLGIDFLYAPVRIPQLTKAHIGLGFAKIGQMEVLARPIRPARFLSKYKKLPALGAFAGPMDWAFRTLTRLAATRVAGSLTVRDEAATEANWQAIEQLFAERTADRISQPWTQQTLSERYRQTREGGDYRVVTAWQGENLAAAAVNRIAERGDHIQVAVIMDMAFRPGAEAEASAVLAAIDAAAVKFDCDLVIYMDGLGSQNRQLMLKRGFRKSPETYEFLIWPKKIAAEDAWVGDWSQWEFGFRDHDAF